MTESYRRIGELISVIDNRNINGDISKLIGISIDKCYIPSVANVIGTDLQNYKVIRKGQFACSLMQVSRDQKIPLAMYPYDDPAIMSPAYVMFEVIDPNTILPEYMELWFMRAEFDREASFYAVGGVRGSLDWEDFCKMKLPVPPITEQRKIVHDYQVITDRIELLRKMNGTFITLCDNLYKKVIEDKGPNGILSDVAYVTSGKRPENLNSGDIPLLGAGGIMDYIAEYNYDEHALIIGRVGTHGVVQRNDRFWASDNTLVIRPKYYEFVFHVLRNIDYSVLNRGSTQPLITQGDLNSVEIYIPDFQELKNFEEKTKTIMSLYSCNEKEILTLTNIATLLTNSLC